MTDARTNPLRLLRAPLVADDRGVVAAPGAVLVRGREILAVGTPETIGSVPEASATEFPDQALLPAFVNSHAHLDLTHAGPVPYGGSFRDWLNHVLTLRRTDPAEIEESVRLGVRLSLAGGVACIGDIAGIRSAAPLEALRGSPLRGTSFIEVFGMGRRETDTVRLMREIVDTLPPDAEDVRRGLQPHAPYSCGPLVFEAAASLGAATGAPVASHIAESLEELEFADRCTGPFADLLHALGMWDDSIVPLGTHPIDALRPALSRGRWLAVHLNYIEDRHVAMLASMPVTVVYCPRASAYFGHPQQGHPPHRYRELRAAGVPVVLGTDSILCLDTADRITPLDDARFLWRRDGADPGWLLEMITTAGATALGLEPREFRIAPGRTAGMIAVKHHGAGLQGVMRSRSVPAWVVAPESVVGEDPTGRFR